MADNQSSISQMAVANQNMGGVKKELRVISDMTKESKVKCESCDKMFVYKSELKGHVKAVHLKIKDLFCNQCEKKFFTRKDLKRHR